MASNDIKLKLKLDQIDADKNLSDMAKGFDKLNARANNFVQRLGNSLTGRGFRSAVQGAASILQQNLGSLLDPSRPSILKQLDVAATAKAKAAGIVFGAGPAGATVGPIMAQAAEIATRQQQAGLRFVVGQVQAGLQNIQALAPGVPLTDRDMKEVSKTEVNFALENLRNARAIARGVENQFPSDQIAALMRRINAVSGTTRTTTAAQKAAQNVQTNDIANTIMRMFGG